MSIKELIFEDLAEIVLPADTLVDYTNVDIETPQDPRFQIARKMDDYVMRVGQVRSHQFPRKDLVAEADIALSHILIFSER